MARFIPNSILGLDIEAICNLHDLMVARASNSHERNEADKEFEKNIFFAIESNKSPWILKVLRKAVAKIYSWSVLVYSRFQKITKHYTFSSRMEVNESKKNFDPK